MNKWILHFQRPIFSIEIYINNMVYHPGIHYLNHYPGALSFSNYCNSFEDQMLVRAKPLPQPFMTYSKFEFQEMNLGEI